MKLDDINDVKEMLSDYLKTYTASHTCNIIKYNSMTKKPHLHEKKRCRG